MVNPVVFGISCVGMDVVLHINILSLIVVPCFFHSSTWVLPQCTFYLHSMWLLYTYILVLLSGVGKALFPNILSQNNWLPRWSWLDDLRVSTFPGFCLRRGIHKVTGVGLGHRVLYVLLVGVHPRFILEFYLSKNYCGIIDLCTRIYSDLSFWSFRQKYFASMQMYLYLMSDMALFTWSFIVVKSDVGVLNSPG